MIEEFGLKGQLSRKGAKTQREKDDSNSEWLSVYLKHPESYKDR